MAADSFNFARCHFVSTVICHLISAILEFYCHLFFPTVEAKLNKYAARIFLINAIFFYVKLLFFIETSNGTILLIRDTLLSFPWIQHSLTRSHSYMSVYLIPRKFFFYITLSIKINRNECILRNFLLVNVQNLLSKYFYLVHNCMTFTKTESRWLVPSNLAPKTKLYC